VVHDAVCGGQDNVSESTRRKDILNPLLEVLRGTVSEARRGGGKGLTPTLQSNLGETTPHLLIRPIRFTTILPERWSSRISNSPM
jgi:hypothetical protein